MHLPTAFPLSSYNFPAVPPAIHPIHLSLTRAAADYHGASLTLFYNYLANSTNRIGGFYLCAYAVYKYARLQSKTTLVIYANPKPLYRKPLNAAIECAQLKVQM